MDYDVSNKMLKANGKKPCNVINGGDVNTDFAKWKVPRINTYTAFDVLPPKQADFLDQKIYYSQELQKALKLLSLHLAGLLY